MNEPARHPDLTIQRADILSVPAQSLIASLNAELSKTYPEQGACHFRLDPQEVAPGQGAFLIASRKQIPVGCGAIRRLDGQSGELKRMYVASEERGRGVGRAILAALEAEARRLGISRLLLETGIRQSAAIALYQHCGFFNIPAFGEYISSPFSLCMAKEIEPAATAS